MSITDSWVERYRPESFADIQGNNKALDQIKSWADGWEPGDQPLLLIGPQGTGKTSTAYVVSDYMGLPIVETNASDKRRSVDRDRLRAQIASQGIDGRRLILLDELDAGRSLTADISEALENPPNPVICTANDEYQIARSIKQECQTFEFSLSKRSRKAKLKEIAEAEALELSQLDLDALSERPDLRSAINDLQRLARQPDQYSIGQDRREWDGSEWEMLDRVLTGTPDLGSIAPSDAIHWLDECISAEFRGLEMATAYQALAAAEQELAAAQREGYWHWKYASPILEQVAKIRQTEPYYGDEISYNNKSFPEWFRHSKPDPSGGSDEARLYRALKSPDAPGMAFGGSYQLFRQVWLPILRELDEDQQCQLIQQERLNPQAYRALGISKSQYQDWREQQ